MSLLRSKMLASILMIIVSVQACMGWLRLTCLHLYTLLTTARHVASVPFVPTLLATPPSVADHLTPPTTDFPINIPIHNITVKPSLLRSHAAAPRLLPGRLRATLLPGKASTCPHPPLPARPPLSSSSSSSLLLSLHMHSSPVSSSPPEKVSSRPRAST